VLCSAANCVTRCLLKGGVAGREPKTLRAKNLTTEKKKRAKHSRSPGQDVVIRDAAKPQTVPQEGPISHGDPAIRFLGSCDDSSKLDVSGHCLPLPHCRWPAHAGSGLFSQFEWSLPLGCDSGGWSQWKTRDSNLVRRSVERVSSCSSEGKLLPAVKPPCRSSE
jgi:hypothetical protein